MSRLLIHIGTHKTGTTAFQQVLLQNEKLLKRKDRIGVIELNDFPRLNELKVSNIFDLSMADELKCFLHKKMITNDRFIISNERLSGNAYGAIYCNTRTIAETLNFATKGYDVTILVALRRQDQFIQSLYMQMQHLGKDTQISDFIRPIQMENLDWSNFLKPWIDHFGSENVKVFPYDKEVLKRHNLVQLLNQEIKSDVLDKIRTLQNANVGLSENGLTIMKEMHHLLSENRRRDLAAILQILSNNDNHEYTLLGINFNKEIIKHFQHSNSELARDHQFLTRFGVNNFSDPQIPVIVERSVRDDYAILVQYLIQNMRVEKSKKNSRALSQIRYTINYFKRLL